MENMTTTSYVYGEMLSFGSYNHILNSNHSHKWGGAYGIQTYAHPILLVVVSSPPPPMGFCYTICKQLLRGKLCVSLKLELLFGQLLL